MTLAMTVINRILIGICSAAAIFKKPMSRAFIKVKRPRVRAAE